MSGNSGAFALMVHNINLHEFKLAHGTPTHLIQEFWLFAVTLLAESPFEMRDLSTRRVFCSSPDTKNKQLNKFKKPKRFLKDENKKIRYKEDTKQTDDQTSGYLYQLSRSSCSRGDFSFSLIPDDL